MNLQYCTTCTQMTNHLDDVCQKCYKRSSSPKIEEWDRLVEEEMGFLHQDGYSGEWAELKKNDIKEIIRSIVTQTRLSTIEELKDEAMKEYGRGQNDGRQYAIEEAKGCVPEAMNTTIADGSEGYNSCRSDTLENLNKLK